MQERTLRANSSLPPAEALGAAVGRAGGVPGSSASALCPLQGSSGLAPCSPGAVTQGTHLSFHTRWELPEIWAQLCR